MEANDEVPAPLGKATHGFHCSGQPSRVNLVATEMAKIEPRAWEYRGMPVFD